ncbi:hypothetical protein H4683_003356 [Filibacter limicola]|uniref:DUF4179 domain-containing protein n=2 Tax=Sporosarcina limicola TaxID=34101 RepID=A0A927R5M8_9BACL|nr:hypothetical protein [Sporosarcina limicola]
MVYPEIRQYEEATIRSINSSFPFQIESNRFDYKIKVKSVETTGNELTVDYSIQNIEIDKFKQDIIQSFVNFIEVINTDNIKSSENGELLYDQTLGHSIRSKQTKLINKDELHFKSTFVIDVPNKFDYEGYSLMVPFGTLSSNDPIKMEPIKITLKN